MLPIKIKTHNRIFNYYTGFSFFIFIWISRKGDNEVSLVNHERIHYWQQLELLFIGHWLLYLSFYFVSRIKGMNHFSAYRSNPFEEEAYANEDDLTYLKKRKPFSWVRYVN